MAFRATAAEQKLEEAGMEPKVARAVTETLEDMYGGLTSTLVTREYLDARLATLESRIDGKLATLESRIDGKLATLESKIDGKLATLETKIGALEKWVVGIGGATLIAVLAALLRDVLMR